MARIVHNMVELCKMILNNGASYWKWWQSSWRKVANTLSSLHKAYDALAAVHYIQYHLKMNSKLATIFDTKLFEHRTHDNEGKVT